MMTRWGSRTADPLCPRVKPGAGFRHLPHKAGKGELCISLLRGEMS